MVDEATYDEEKSGGAVGSKENVSKVASVKSGSTISTATSNVNTPKIMSYADAVQTG